MKFNNEDDDKEAKPVNRQTQGLVDGDKNFDRYARPRRKQGMRVVGLGYRPTEFVRGMTDFSDEDDGS